MSKKKTKSKKTKLGQGLIKGLKSAIKKEQPTQRRKKKIVGYICANTTYDLQQGIGEAKIYSSVAALKEAKPCAAKCGVVALAEHKVITKPMSIRQIAAEIMRKQERILRKLKD